MANRSPLAAAVSGYTSPRLFSRRESEDTKPQKNPRYIKEYKSDYKIIPFRHTSQYPKRSISSCRLAAIDFVSRILPVISTSSEDDITECLPIMSMCSLWDIDKYLEVREILRLPLFSCHLETIEVQDDHCMPSSFRKLTQALVINGPSAAIITRASEIVALMSIPPARSGYKSEGSLGLVGNRMVIFDPHPRSDHPLGAAFLVFPNPDEAAIYLSTLFEIEATHLMDPNNRKALMYSARILKARQSPKQEELDALYSANLNLSGVNVQMKEALNEVQRELKNTKELVKSFLGVQTPDFQPPSGYGSRARQLFEDGNRKEFRLEQVNTDAKGKGPDVRDSFHGLVDNEATKYEHVRIERLERLEISSQSRFKPKDAPLPDAPALAGRDLPSKNPFKNRNFAAYMMETRRDDFARTHQYESVRVEWLKGLQFSSQNPFKDPPFPKAPALEIRDFPSINPSINRDLATRMLKMERDDFEQARQLQMEEDRKALEHVRAMQGSDEGFKCEICMEFWSLGMVAHVDDCEHMICRDCMKGHIRAELDMKRWPITCPICRAEKRSEPGVIYRHVAELAGADDEMITRWNEVELAAVSVQVMCSTCKRSANIDVKDFNEADILHCPHNCGAYWCKKCSQRTYRGRRHTCNGDAEFERWRKDNPDVRLCPGCRMPIQRTEGCRHMVCIRPGCNTHFCDRCGDKLIQSQSKREIDMAVEKHFSGECKLFDYEFEE